MDDESLSTARSKSQEEGKMGTLTDLLGPVKLPLH